jgi:hypothetical protein
MADTVGTMFPGTIVPIPLEMHRFIQIKWEVQCPSTDTPEGGVPGSENQYGLPLLD